MTRVVVDANVLVSAALGRSPSAPSALVLEAALDKRVEIVTSPTLMRQRRIASRDHRSRSPFDGRVDEFEQVITLRELVQRLQA